MPEVSPAQIVASWPTEPVWNHALVNPVVAPDDTHPMSFSCYDEAGDTRVVFLPDGSRRHVAFVREQTTRDYLWRRGYVDQTEAFRALAADLDRSKNAAATEAERIAEIEATILAAVRSSDAPRGVTALFVARTTKLALDVVEPRLAALVAGGKIERVGEGGPVVLFREPKRAA